MMQVLSHRTRAYIWNEDGLQGFVEKLGLIEALQRAHTLGSLADAMEWQMIDINILVDNLQACDTDK